MYKNKQSGKTAEFIKEEDGWVYLKIDGIEIVLAKNQWERLYESYSTN